MATKDNDTTQEHKKSLTLELSAKTRKRLDGLDETGGAPQRSKTVTVEVKRSRRFRSPQASSASSQNPKDQGLTTREQSARLEALQTALQKEEEARNAPPPPLTPQTPEPKKSVDISRPAVADTPPLPVSPDTARQMRDKKSGRGDRFEDEDSEATRKKASRKTGASKREDRTDLRSLAQLYSDDDEASPAQSTTPPPPPRSVRTPSVRVGTRRPIVKATRTVELAETISVRDLAALMSEKLASVLKVAVKMGLMITANQTLDAATAELIVLEMGHTPVRQKTRSEKLSELETRASNLDGSTQVVTRPPVVTIMGHVDHGKTSLLDALRKTNVAGKEAGGITQSIGAYQVGVAGDQKITFIDTPGHAAFTQMRARGANLTDIVILLVAADDGLMEQTIEAIDHAKAAGVPIIVAINKIDKPEANADKVRQALLGHDIVVETLGGDVLDVEVSAKTGKNLDKLCDAILLQAELLELKGAVDTPAKGIVLEARQDKQRGTLTSVLIQSGTLRKGDVFVSGKTLGRVRFLSSDQGQPITSASLSEPVEVLGFQEVPSAGDDFFVMTDEATAREIITLREERDAAAQKAQHAAVSLEGLLKKTGGKKELSIILKADTFGSLEAVQSTLERIEHPEVKAKIIRKGVGTFTENDAHLAKMSGALLLGFDVTLRPEFRELARTLNVEVQTYDIIYHLVENIRNLMAGLLSPEKKEVFLGEAEIRRVFVVKKGDKIAGCYVTKGLIKRGAQARVKRGDKILCETVITSLKREKNDAREVREKYECGICLDKFDDFVEGDVIQAFEFENIKRTLDS